MPAASSVVWALHEGKIGLANQALGVAEATGLAVVEKRLSIRLPWLVLPPALWLKALSAPGTDGDRLEPPWPAAVVSAGGRAAAPAAAIGRASGGKCLAIQVQNPHMPLRCFDLMVIPEHDRVSGANVLVTRGAVHRVTKEKLAAAAVEWGPRLDHLPRPRVAVLIGGGNASYRMPPERLQQIAESLAALARQGLGLMVTPSRRTGAAAETILRQALAGFPAAYWDGSGDNPYLGYLALADQVLATADSISMVTEASMTGRPIHIIELPGGSAKFHDFHRSMQQAGVTRPFTGALDSWSYPIRNDTELAGARIREMLAGR